jgi:periplasmic copper chaperone A
MRTLKTGLVGLLLLACPAAAQQPADGATISAAWTPPLPSAGADTPLFMTISNRGDVADDLVRVRCPVAFATELQVTDHGEGAPAARVVRNIPVPAQNVVTLEPDGSHVMLLHVGQALSKGESIPCTVYLRTSGAHEISVTVADSELKR